MSDNIKNWVVIPAAGVGSRMQSDIPKQYIPINGKTVIEHTLECFIHRNDVEAVVVVISSNDEKWSGLDVANHEKVIKAPGGDERYQSVLNGLECLSNKADDEDWVMVHDAARPCLHQSAIDRLLTNLKSHPVGGILALQCRDTMKRQNENGEIEATIERENLWQAQTPQMFRFGKLKSALHKVIDDALMVTDEAMAMELAGYSPKLINGHQENIKLTINDDLFIIETYLKSMSEK